MRSLRFSDDSETDTHEDEVQSNHTRKVIFTSRTHSQLSQFLSMFRFLEPIRRSLQVNLRKRGLQRVCLW